MAVIESQHFLPQNIINNYNDNTLFAYIDKENYKSFLRVHLPESIIVVSIETRENFIFQHDDIR